MRDPWKTVGKGKRMFFFVRAPSSPDFLFDFAFFVWFTWNLNDDENVMDNRWWQ